MNVVVWIVQGVLAAVFLGAGAMKLFQPRAKLMADPKMGWAGDFSDSMVKTIGALEILAAIGLVLPWLTGIAKVLTPLAAVGLVLMMIGAVVVHVRRKENAAVPPGVVLGLLAAFVAWARFGGVA
ncbi:DoxX family protein [Actinokineospora sp.]|uniref:DoxX family protein n=1 Tax=Actinokineospora sp. TaxID=1872133 RepID=UPI0040377EAD